MVAHPSIPIGYEWFFTKQGTELPPGLSADCPISAEDAMKVDITKPMAAFVMITPSLADHWLSTYNTNNRSIKKATLRILAEDIRNNAWWSEHPDAVVFGKEGHLYNAQHRLFNIVITGKAVVMRVMFGVDKVRKPLLDTSVARAHYERYVLYDGFYKEEKYGKGKNKHLCQLVTAHFNLMEMTTTKATPREFLLVFKKFAKPFLWWANLQKGKTSRLNQPCVGLALSHYYMIDPAKAEEFANILFSNANAPEYGLLRVVNVLRDYLLKGEYKFKREGQTARVGSYSTKQKAIYGACVFAMKAHRDGKQSLGRLKTDHWEHMDKTRRIITGSVGTTPVISITNMTSATFPKIKLLKKSQPSQQAQHS